MKVNPSKIKMKMHEDISEDMLDGIYIIPFDNYLTQSDKTSYTTSNYVHSNVTPVQFMYKSKQFYAKQYPWIKYPLIFLKDIESKICFN